ncbi:MAG: endonuclease III [Alphaproteobacteria bacterium CG11_big_fil_rev_8_21_14_0_20_39_49]|nr:MAG: endonuclease III [Alphaproteobacteria bacterium CG11_big_fil_rev_8_21_14_0_20_39_49]
MKKETVDKIFSVFSKQNPEPETELNYVNNYTLLVAVVLSAQATDIGVNKATESLFKAVKTPEEMVALGEEGLKKYIKTIGLFNSKAKNVIALSNILVEKHNSQVPDNFESLKALPGVGVKTADVVLNCAFGKPTIAVDTHVFRVSNRLGLVKTKTPDATGAKLLKVIPSKWLQHAHHWLILHGRYVCKARKPLCYRCDVINFCEYKDKNLGSK